MTHSIQPSHAVLRDLAEKATPGTWEAFDDWTNTRLTDPDVLLVRVARYDDYASVEDVRFMAAANPSNVLTLLDEVARLRARVRVEASDVARVVTREQVTAWARCFGISFDEDEDLGDAWQTAAALIITMRADDCSGQWDILDEMAAMPPETSR
jgi:hypothetical protein